MGATEDQTQDDTWSGVAAPIVRKLEVGAVFGDATVFNQVGSASLARFIKRLAIAADRSAELERRFERRGVFIFLGGYGLSTAIIGDGLMQSCGVGLTTFAAVYLMLSWRRG